MIDWNKELERIFDDPLLADVTAPRSRATSSDRLVAGFQQLQDFYAVNNRLPQNCAAESQLYQMLQGILADEAKMARCRPFDDYGLLSGQSTTMVEEPSSPYGLPPEPARELTPDEQLAAILDDPLLADVEAKDGSDLFDLPDYMREKLKTRREAEYVGKRQPCQDFEQYKSAFEDIHNGLKRGRYRLIKFSVANLKVGSYFVEDGIIGYLAAFDDEGIDRYGNRDGRTRVIYENGTEADIKYKTITKNLSVTGYSVQDCADMTDEELSKHFSVGVGDIESGTIYVLRSRSTRPEIAGIKNLYKIGFTVTSVESRIANARNEPTYLMADVDVVATWRVYNVKSSTLEALIHRLFASVQLQATVNGHTPKEWFIVPFPIIEEAVLAIISGTPIEYDRNLQQIVRQN